MATAEHETAEHQQAFSLCAFVHVKTPLFPLRDALKVVQNLSPSPGDNDLKSLAKRLRKELETHGVKLSHTAAIDAAAKLAGFKDWFEAAKRHEAPKRLKVLTVSNGTIYESFFPDWAAAKSLMCEVCEGWQASTGANTFEIKLGKGYPLLTAPVTLADDNGPRVQSDSLLSVNPVTADDVNWLHGAEQAIEALRRRLEETGKATLNGVAVTQLCENMTDALNSELVVRSNNKVT